MKQKAHPASGKSKEVFVIVTIFFILKRFIFLNLYRSSKSIQKFIRQRKNNMNLKNEENHLAFSKKILERLKKKKQI